MEKELNTIKSQAHQEIAQAQTLSELDQIKTKYLGRKGALTKILQTIKELPPQQRPQIGKLTNQLKQEINNLLTQHYQAIKIKEQEDKLKFETIDVTLPGRALKLGRIHPLTQVLDQVKQIFIGLGFEVVEGPEIELEYYNFTALNFPEHHPVRDEHDSFYITDQILLRTETSAVQIRIMEQRRPPIRVIAPGRVHRRDVVDATHSHTFHQVEGLLVDRDVTFADLKGTLTAFAKQMFAEDIKIRFRPDYFPFTEPSADMTISCIICGGKGCRVCSNSGWLEILGCGMVHPQVLKNVNYDPEEFIGYAFGMGLDRIVMLKYGIEDMRILTENDLRFLEQF